jgi:hypothetical protein
VQALPGEQDWQYIFPLSPTQVHHVVPLGCFEHEQLGAADATLAKITAVNSAITQASTRFLIRDCSKGRLVRNARRRKIRGNVPGDTKGAEMSSAKTLGLASMDGAPRNIALLSTVTTHDSRRIAGTGSVAAWG